MENNYGWTKEEVILKIQEFFNKKNRTTKLFNEDINKIYYRLDYGLQKLKEYFNIYGKTLNKLEYKKLKLSPSYEWYQGNFGSYYNACFIAGLRDKPLTKEEKIQVSIDELIKLGNELKRCPFVREYENFTNNYKGYGRNTLESKLKMKYNDICRKYIPQYNIIHNMDIKTKEELISDLTKLKNKLGRTPMSKEISCNDITFSLTVYKNVFKQPYNQIIKDLGWELSRNKHIKKTNVELLEDFKTLFIELGRIPIYSKIARCSGMASYDTYLYRFKTIQNVCSLLNIDFSKYNQPVGLYKTSYDKLGNTCRSSIELMINNYFIDNNIDFQRQPSYKLYDGDRRRFDWKVGELLIEYAGLYDLKSNSKICKSYVPKIHKKIEDLKQAGIYDKCLFIYPEDIKNKTLDEIFSPYINVS